MLNSKGWVVDCAENGLIGVNILFGQPISNEDLSFDPSLESRDVYNLVLVDVQMPVMNGFETIECIRDKEKILMARYPDVKRIPLIVLTASSFQQEEERCMQIGADGFLLKPLRKDVLLNCVKKYQSTVPSKST